MENKRPEIPGRFVFFILAIIAVMMLFVSFTTGFSGGYLKTAQQILFIPMQRGIDMVSGRITLSIKEAATIEELQVENKALRAEVERLSSELSNVELRQKELEDLRGLFSLKQTYSDYETTGAYVIGGGTGNWTNTFVIDKGKKDGLAPDMNVLAGDGLVGIIKQTGSDYSIVEAIIDDTVNISGRVSSSGDNCIISGSLQSMTDKGMIMLSGLEDESDSVKVGDAVVTSPISDRYVPGLLIGYVNSIEKDSNGLTKSGYIVPVADFKHLNEVLVVTTLKQTADS